MSALKKFCLGAVILPKGLLLAADVGTWDLLTDFVYMQRYHVQDQTLVIDSSQPVCSPSGCAPAKVLDTQDLDNHFGFEPGVRLSLSYVPDRKSLYEASFLYLWQWNATSTRQGDGTLSFPFQDPSFVSGFSQADSMTASYHSRFYTAELNYFGTLSKSRRSFFSLLGLCGIRFIEVAEKFSLESTKANEQSVYRVSTHNDLIGVQTGFLFSMNPYLGLHWDLDVKAGVALNRIGSKVFLGGDQEESATRNFSRQGGRSALFSEVAAGVGYRVASWLNLHLGYEMIYVNSLGLAPDQLRTSSTLSSTLSDDDYIIVNGLYAGCLFSF